MDGIEKEEPELSEKKPGIAADDLQEQDDYLEEALEETFPGSDPISPGHVTRKKS